MRAVPNDEVSQFFARFFDQWARTTDFERLAATFADREQFGVAPSGRELEKADNSVIRLTLQLWRVLDHGRVAALGHRVPREPGARGALAALIETEGMLRPYETVGRAFLPMTASGAPFLVARPSGTEVYVAQARFRHAPRDTLIVSAQRRGRELE